MENTIDPGSRKTCNIMRACEMVGVSRRTIYNWLADGKVEYIRTAGGSVRIFIDTLWRMPGNDSISQMREQQERRVAREVSR